MLERAYVRAYTRAMPTEIERKFLVSGDAWRTTAPTRISQGYLNGDKHRTVRVRQFEGAWK